MPFSVLSLSHAARDPVLICFSQPVRSWPGIIPACARASRSDRHRHTAPRAAQAARPLWNKQWRKEKDEAQKVSFTPWYPQASQMATADLRDMDPDPPGFYLDFPLFLFPLFLSYCSLSFSVFAFSFSVFLSFPSPRSDILIPSPPFLSLLHVLSKLRLYGFWSARFSRPRSRFLTSLYILFSLYSPCFSLYSTCFSLSLFSL